MKTGFFLFIALFFSSAVFASVEITEIMYAPNAEWGGQYNEWVELHNPEDSMMDTSACFFQNEPVSGILPPYSYMVLVRKEEPFLANYSITNYLPLSFGSLNNEKEVLLSLNCDQNNYSVVYTPTTESKRGRTLEKTNTGEWKESLIYGGTPGRSNSVDEEMPPSEPSPPAIKISLSTHLGETIYLNNIYASLFSINIKGKENCSRKDTVTVFYNISKHGSLVKEDTFTKEIGCSSYASTGEFIPEETGNYTLCGLITNSTANENHFENGAVCTDFEAISTFSWPCDINLEINKTNRTIFYENGQTIKFTPEINDENFPFIIEYWIEDLFGSIVKDKFNTTNTNQKSWKTNIWEEDRVLLLKAIVYPSCNDTNIADNVAESMFIVTKTGELELSSSNEGELSTINITEISPQPASFGGVIKADVEIYKNSTNKYSLSAWAEKSGKVISEETKVNLKTKNTLYELTLPVQIKPNCDAKIEGGAAILVVEGLGISVEKEFTIEGIDKGLCKESTIYIEKVKAGINEAANNGKNTIQIIGLPAEIDAGETFRLKVQFINNQDAEFTAWSYLYRGSKCYSCFSEGRDENQISFPVNKGETKMVEMLVTADQDLTAGDYNLMVKYKKDSQKTEKSISQKISVGQQAQYSNQGLPMFSSKEGSSVSLEEKAEKKSYGQSGIVVYESTAERSKNLISWVLFAAFGLLSIALVIDRGNT
ncbi:MAG: hypothetical protein AABW53_00135 [Nanoarchaeota archaeon]